MTWREMSKNGALNEVPDGYRIMTAGAWNEPAYMFSYADKYPPTFRAANLVPLHETARRRR